MTCGPLAVFSTSTTITRMLFATGKAFEPRFIVFAELTFGLSKFNDDVAVLEPLHNAIHHFTDMLVVLGVHALALKLHELSGKSPV